MTVVVTRDVADRFRGLLASVMLEIAPGVYTSPDLARSVRERLWAVLDDWHRELRTGSVVITWPEAGASGGQAILTLGIPARVLVDHEGIVLAKREL
jgi:CRISPR-associated protein Cas2